MMDIVDKARRSLSAFCQHECHAYCCRKGTLSLERSEEHLFPDNVGGRVDLNHGCSALLFSRCSIYKKRPQMCSDFPIFRKNGSVFIISDCPGVMAGRLYPYIAAMKQDKIKVYYV